MAIDNRLRVYDEQGNPVDYDILASDVKFMPDGKDLPTKLAEMQEEIEDAAGGGYAPPAGGIPKSDLASGVQSSLDKADTALQQSDKTELQNEIDNKVDKVPNKGLSTNDFTDALLAKLNNLDPYTKAQVDALIAAAGSGAVSVTSNQDGTFTIHVGETDYTINLNHTHEGMVKLEKYTEATLPQTLYDDIIYVQVDDVTSPQAIEALYIFGLEFTGGGAAPGTPGITSPSGTTINLGENSGSGVSKAIGIRANSHITGGITVGLAANSDLSFDTSNLPSGVTYNSGTGTLTIDQLTAMQGVNITIIYSGSGAAEIQGGVIISCGGSVLRTYNVEVKVGYISTGLVFHLDGADASTTEWIDRVGNIAFAMNNVTLDGHGGVVFNGTNSYGRYSAASSLDFKPHTHTIEVVANIEGTATSVLFMQNNESDLAFGITGTGNLIACSQTNTENKTYQRRVQNVSRGLMSFSFANNAAYKNKTAQTVENNGCFDPTANAGVFIGARDTTRSFLQGTIYQIRVYNRILDTAEILANQQIDIDRYNIQ